MIEVIPDDLGVFVESFTPCAIDPTTPVLLARSPSALVSPPPVPLMNAAEGEQLIVHDKPIPRRAKRVRLLLDARTELTDDELKVRRAYMRLGPVDNTKLYN